MEFTVLEAESILMMAIFAQQLHEITPSIIEGMVAEYNQMFNFNLVDTIALESLLFDRYIPDCEE